MASIPLRTVPRDKLFTVFKDWDLVRLFEQMLNAVGDVLPEAAQAVQDNLDAHIADTTDAHQASAIGSTPVGGISANNVQAALAELDSEKLAVSLVSAFMLTLLDDPDALTARSTLGLAAIAASGSLSDLGGLGSGVATFLATPNSANLRGALTDETGTGSAVFGTGPTINSPTFTGTTYFEQNTPTTKSGAATLTTAELLTAIIEYTGAANTLTLPTGANIDAAISGLGNNGAFSFSVINTGSGTATMGTNTGLTLTGNMGVANGSSGRFVVRKTATATYTIYRIA